MTDLPMDAPAQRGRGNRRALAVVVGAGIASAATVAALLASGGATHAAAPSSPAARATHYPAAIDPAGPTKQHNKAAAVEEAQQLAVVPLPQGAAPIAAVPHLSPAMGMGISNQQIDVTHFYRFPFAVGDDATWFSKHPARGIFSGTARSGTIHATVVSGFSWDERANSAWDAAQTQVSFAADGPRSSFVRVDGVVRWYDPTPVPDRSTGVRLRVTVAGGCPASDKGAADVTNDPSADLERQLVPSAAPTAELVCHYDGGNGHPFQLVGQQHVTGAGAVSDAKRYREMRVGRHGLDMIDCPADDGKADIVAFTYAGRSDLDLWHKTNGCTDVTNGFIVSSWF